MSVDEAIKTLTEIREGGNGHLPVQILAVNNGVTTAIDISMYKAEPYDGDRVWIYAKVVE